MIADRAERTGAVAALGLHVAIIAALSLSLASVEKELEPPAMDVEFVDEVALESAAPQSVPTLSAPPPAPIEEALPESIAAPPTPRAVPQPTPRPQPTPPRQIQKQVAKPVKRPPPKPAQRPAPRQGLGDDFLSKLDDDLAPRAGPSKPAAPTFNAQARASVGQAILRQAQRCADRQPFIGEGANRIRMTVNLKFARSGRLSRPPAILRTSGDPELRAKYGELLEDQVRRIFTDCAPFRLPAELYDTDDGGWKDFTFTYRVD